MKLCSHGLLILTILLSTHFATAPTATAGELKIMSYNIWGLPYPIAKRMKRLKILKKSISKIDVDIIGFQEAFTKKALKVTNQASFPYKAFGPGSSFLRLSSGLVLLSKYPIIKTDMIQFKKCQGWDCRANKGVLFSRVDLGDDNIDIYLTHLNAEGSDMGPRLTQVRQLINFVQKNSTGNKVIFIGDFNFTEESILHTMMTNILALNDVHQQYVLDNPDLSIEDRNGYTNGRSTKRIDYIWASPELYGRSIKVIMKERLYKNEPLSDHMAVIGTIEY